MTAYKSGPRKSARLVSDRSDPPAWADLLETDQREAYVAAHQEETAPSLPPLGPALFAPSQTSFESTSRLVRGRLVGFENVGFLGESKGDSNISGVMTALHQILRATGISVKEAQEARLEILDQVAKAMPLQPSGNPVDEQEISHQELVTLVARIIRGDEEARAEIFRRVEELTADNLQEVTHLAAAQANATVRCRECGQPIFSDGSSCPREHGVRGYALKLLSGVLCFLGETASDEVVYGETVLRARYAMEDNAADNLATLLTVIDQLGLGNTDDPRVQAARTFQEDSNPTLL